MEVGPKVSEKNEEETELLAREVTSEESLIPFVCCVCGINVKCRFGKVRVNGGTHNYAYKEEVYYIMDPFRNRTKTDKRRVTNEERKNIQKQSRGNAPNILDFLVVGALCVICGQSVCIDELCSVFYAKTFCSTCLTREKAHFPPEILQQLELARAARKRRQAEVVKPPTVEDVDKDVGE